MNKEKRLEFNRRFALGEQYLTIMDDTIIDIGKQYFWEEQEVYNHILPIINLMKAKYEIEDEEIYGEFGLVEQLMPIQRAYNAIKNKKYELISRISNGVLLVEDGSVDVDNLDEEGLSGGKVIVYRQGAIKPELLKFENILDSVTEEEKNLLKEFEFIKNSFELKYKNEFSNLKNNKKRK